MSPTDLIGWDATTGWVAPAHLSIAVAVDSSLSSTWAALSRQVERAVYVASLGARSISFDQHPVGAEVQNRLGVSVSDGALQSVRRRRIAVDLSLPGDGVVERLRGPLDLSLELSRYVVESADAWLLAEDDTAGYGRVRLDPGRGETVATLIALGQQRPELERCFPLSFGTSASAAEAALGWPDDGGCAAAVDMYGFSSFGVHRLLRAAHGLSSVVRATSLRVATAASERPLGAQLTSQALGRLQQEGLLPNAVAQEWLVLAAQDPAGRMIISDAAQAARWRLLLGAPASACAHAHLSPETGHVVVRPCWRDGAVADADARAAGVLLLRLIGWQDAADHLNAGV